jgi:2-dehydro-3-deoxyglucarate aldolase
MKSDFRARLRRGERLIGTLVTLPSPEIAEALAAMGFDWLFIDCEHGAFDPLMAQRMLQAVGSRCASVIRVPAADEVWIKKALDIGADGIIVPQIESAAQAEAVVSFCKYPPSGRRGIGIGRAHAYGLRFSETLSTANDTVAVILQAERAEAVSDIAKIAAVAGIDAILVGPYDLSASLGKTGMLDDAQVLEAIETVRRACSERSLAMGFFGVSTQAVRPYMECGFNLIAVGTDALFLGRAAKEALGELRAPDRPENGC